MSKTISENFNQALLDNPLFQFLGQSNVEEFQKRVMDAIVDRVVLDLQDYSNYIIYPPDHEEIINDAYDKVSKKIQKMYEGTMLEIAQKSIDKWKKESDING